MPQFASCERTAIALPLLLLLLLPFPSCEQSQLLPVASGQLPFWCCRNQSAKCGPQNCIYLFISEILFPLEVVRRLVVVVVVAVAWDAWAAALIWPRCNEVIQFAHRLSFWHAKVLITWRWTGKWCEKEMGIELGETEAVRNGIQISDRERNKERENERREREYDTGRGPRDWEQYTYIYKEQYTETEIETQMR